MRSAHTQAAARGTTLLRLVLGMVMLLAGASKLALSWIGGFLPVPVVSLEWQRDLPQRLGQWLTANPDGVLAAVVRDLILPHGALYAGAMAWLQVTTGILLVLGLFTRLAAFVVGAIMAALALVAMSGGSGGARVYLLLGCIALALLLGDAGQTVGLDGWRRERKRGREF